MRAFFYIKALLLFLTLLVFSSPGEATHIRAGEITAERVNNTTFLFTLTMYLNSGAMAENDSATFDFGDATSATVHYTSSVVINSKTYRRIYKYQKTFSGNGTYRVSYFEVFRNEQIRNVANGNNFYVETFVSVASFSAFNNPVQLAVPPLDQGAVGKLFVHNAGAYDPDGDSISYKLIVPKNAPGTNVMGYFTPEASTSFSLDPITGDLVWDRPQIAGLYNVAFIIEEWKKGVSGAYVRVGYVTRDMQIEIINSTNNPPVLIIPEDTCVVSGNPIIKTIRATDPDPGDRIKITANPPDYFTFSGPQFSPATGTFNWTPQCTDVRSQPYTFVFKAVDIDGADTLSNYKTWLIYVKGPAPTGLDATPVGNTITLTWNPYPCTNADKIEIYRKACDSSAYNQKPCETGITGFSGYVKVGEALANATSFTDNNNLKRGVEYCYFLIAKFPAPKEGESHASILSCTSLKLDVPILTNVNVTVTSATAGEIAIEWMKPTEAPSSIPSPYSYIIQRANGINGTVFTNIDTIIEPLLSYTDSGLNTLDGGYTYRVLLVGGGFSDIASTTYLSNVPGDRRMNLTWNSRVPWAEDSVWLYRSLNGGAYVQIASLGGNPKTYADVQGLTNCDTACYFVRVFSSYCDPKLPALSFENNSQYSCGSPVDVNPPKAPTLTVKGCEGDLSVFTDQLDWDDVGDPLCNNIRNYNIYFSEYMDTDLSLIATTDFTVTDYIYTNLKTTAGCFSVSAVNRQGVEGLKSEKICVDDCVFYELPNLITPNGDSLNDYYRPFPIPRGVEVVGFKVYNRWGGLVFSIDNNINLHWTGRAKDGEKLSDGVYYFSAEVKYFRRLNRKDEHRTIKGWVHVLNNTNSPGLE